MNFWIMEFDNNVSFITIDEATNQKTLFATVERSGGKYGDEQLKRMEAIADELNDRGYYSEIVSDYRSAEVITDDRKEKTEISEFLDKLDWEHSEKFLNRESYDR